MRARFLEWFALCLLVVAGAWLLFHSSRTAPADKAARRAVFTSVHSGATAPDPLAGLANPAGASPAGVVKTNRYAYRLTNTAKPLGELVHDRRAVLLENALIDTGSPLNFSIPKHLRAAGDPGAYIVQARGPITAAFRATLAQAGAGIVSYIPNDAYLVRVPAAGAGALAAQSAGAVGDSLRAVLQDSSLAAGPGRGAEIPAGERAVEPRPVRRRRGPDHPAD